MHAPVTLGGLALAFLVHRTLALFTNDHFQHEIRRQAYSNSSLLPPGSPSPIDSNSQTQTPPLSEPCSLGYSDAGSTPSISGTLSSQSSLNTATSSTSPFPIISTPGLPSDDINPIMPTDPSMSFNVTAPLRPPMETNGLNSTDNECSGTSTDDGQTTVTFFSTTTETLTVTVTDENVTFSQPPISYPPLPCFTVTAVAFSITALSSCHDCPPPTSPAFAPSRSKKTTRAIVTKKTIVPQYGGSSITTPSYPGHTDSPGGNVDKPNPGDSDRGNQPPTSSQGSGDTGGSSGDSPPGSSGGSSGGSSNSSPNGQSGGSSNGAPGQPSGGSAGASSPGTGSAGGGQPQSNPGIGDIIASAFYNPPAPSPGSNSANQGSFGGANGDSGGSNGGPGNSDSGHSVSPTVGTTLGGVAVSVDSSNAIIGGKTVPIPKAGSPPNMVTVNGQTFTISPTQITGGGGNVLVPAAGLTPMTIGGVDLSVGASQAVISGTTYTIGSNAPSTTVVVNGQKLIIGPMGVVFATTTVPPDVMVTAPPLAAVNAGGVEILVGASEAVISGTTYHIGSGAAVTTAVINGVTLSFGPEGVGLPSTTIHPGARITNPPLMSTVTTDGLTFSTDGTEAVISGMTYKIGTGATATTVVIGGKTISFGPSGVGLVPTTGSGAQTTSSPGVFATGAHQTSKPTGGTSTPNSPLRNSAPFLLAMIVMMILF